MFDMPFVMPFVMPFAMPFVMPFVMPFDIGFFGNKFLITNDTCYGPVFGYGPVYEPVYVYGYDLFVCMCVLSVSMFLGTMFISRNVYAVMKNDFCRIYNNNRESLEYDPFLFECLEEFDEMEMELDEMDELANDNGANDNGANDNGAGVGIDSVDSNVNRRSVIGEAELKLLKWKFVNWETKFGRIIMHYDSKNEGFDYYCRTPNLLSYEYLEVISRIYVVKYKCTRLYVEPSVKFIETAAASDSKKKDVNIFYSNKYSKQNTGDETRDVKTRREYVSNKYKYKGSVHKFMKKCEMYKYDVLEDGDEGDGDAVLEDEVNEAKMGKYFSLIKGEGKGIEKGLGKEEKKVTFSDMSDFSDGVDDVSDDECNAKMSFKKFKIKF